MLGVCCGTSKHHPNIAVLKTGVDTKPTYLSRLFCHSSGWSVRVYGNCIHNQYKALSERHITDRTYIGFDRSEFLRLTREPFRELYRKIDWKTVHLSSTRQIVNSYTGGKRKIYERAEKEVLRVSYDKSWHKVRMFVKPDKHDICTIKDKVPRAIQYRRPEFNLKLAQYLRPLEKKLFNFVEEDGTRVFAKCRNLQERAQDILDIFSKFEDPIVISTDHSKFDSFVNVHHLRAIHRFYLKIFPSKTLQSLLSRQIENRGFSIQGLKYKVRGTRMSGDYDTSLGNCVLNYVVLKAWLAYCGIKGKVYIDGDDAVVVIERTDLSKVKKEIFKKLGFETKVEIESVDNFEFCQARLIRSNPPILVRDPRKVLSNLQVCLKRYSPGQWPALLQGKLICEFWANQGVPYVCSYIHSLLDRKLPFDIPPEDLRRWSLVKTHKIAKITPQSYRDLYTTWNFGSLDIKEFYTPLAYCLPVLRKSGPAAKRQYEWTSSSLQRIKAQVSWLDVTCGPRCGPSCGGPREEVFQPAVCSAEPVRVQAPN